MIKVLIVSRTEEENYILRRRLEPLAGEMGPMRFFSVRPQGLGGSAEPDLAVVVMHMVTFEPLHRDAIVQARAAGYHGPILVIAKASAETLTDIEGMPRVVLLDKPYDSKDLVGLVKKFLIEHQVAQRVHRRYPTAQRAEVEILAQKTKSKSMLYNLSKGGAYFEFPNTQKVKIGDIVNLSIELKDVRRSYMLPAKIVWTTEVGMGGGHGIGVEFVGRGDLSHNILGAV